MAPTPLGTWHETMVEELYTSLLGQKLGGESLEEQKKKIAFIIYTHTPKKKKKSFILEQSFVESLPEINK